jgi:hypothetical protein
MDFLYLSKNANTVTVSILSYKPATMHRQIGGMVKHSDWYSGGGGGLGVFRFESGGGADISLQVSCGFTRPSVYHLMLRNL